MDCSGGLLSVKAWVYMQKTRYFHTSWWQTGFQLNKPSIKWKAGLQLINSRFDAHQAEIFLKNLRLCETWGFHANNPKLVIQLVDHLSYVFWMNKKSLTRSLGFHENILSLVTPWIYYHHSGLPLKNPGLLHKLTRIGCTCSLLQPTCHT